MMAENFNIGNVLGLTVSLISIVSVIWLAAVKITTLEVKVETIWSFLMRRAISEAIVHPHIVESHNSPIIITEEAKRWAEPIIAPLREFYANLGRRNMTELGTRL